eukprot:TRINITY_DN18805_c0_g1_i1.p1 TRINITY_DN18805_c0_g1~~TRINITY_DN18805_c0_g1_i1.p1  ORF type:complete len:319 (-),score=84.50 TRINITY_DN18805_c0_g1_i1:13-969(-)
MEGKAVLRKSGKRVDNLISQSSEFISVEVFKSGNLTLLDKKPKQYHFFLCGSVLYWKNREHSTTIQGELAITGATVEKSPSMNSKNLLAFTVKVADKALVLGAEKEADMEEWMNLMKGTTPPESAPDSTAKPKKDTRMLRAQKKVGGTMATTAAGKKVIREALGPDNYKAMMTLKKVVAALDGKKKAKEVEETIIKIGLKVILLAKNKDLTLADLRMHKEAIKSVCEVMAHQIVFQFEYEPGPNGKVQQAFNDTAIQIATSLEKYISPKNMTRYHDLRKYLTSGPIIDALYQDPKFKEQRKNWNYLTKNILYILNLIQ